MTRKEIEAEYTIENGVIRNSGKFEGEALYVPYFWDAYLNGFAEENDDGTLLFYVDDFDRDEFPELGDVTAVCLRSDDNGFVGEC